MNRTEYIGKLNALYVGDKNCLEELITAYDEKDKEIERLNNIINEIYTFLSQYTITHTWQKVVIEDTIKYIDEMKGSDKE